MAIKKINTDLQIEAGLLDGDGNSGTANQILISTGTGVDWVDGSGSSIIGGPYLPLSAGSGKRVTGDLYIDNKLYMRPSSTYGNGYKVMDVTGTGNPPYPTILSFSNYGRSSVMVLNDDKVGIGTTSPSAPLDVFGVRAGRDWAIADRAVIRLDSNGVSKPSDIVFGHTAAANQTSWTGAYWSLSSRGSSADNKFIFYRGNGNPDGSGEATIMTFDPDLNVGIGTTNPGAKLHVDSASDFNVALSKRASTTSAIKFTLSDPSVTTNTWKIEHDSSENLQIFGYSADSLLISTNSIERMRVASNGNVGIGTTNPTAKLEVNGDIKSQKHVILPGPQQGTVTTAMGAYKGGYNITMPESGQMPGNPYFMSDLAYFTKKGGTVTVTGLTSSLNLDTVFRPDAGISSVSGSAYTGSTFTIELSDVNDVSNLIYGTRIGIAFGSPSFMPSSMLIEYSTDSGTNYTTALNSSKENHFYYTYANNGGSAITNIKFTIGLPFYSNVNQVRITNIFATDYAGDGMKNYFVPAEGGNYYGDVTFKDNKQLNFGDSGDLRIYHDGSNSYIDETGAGNLFVRAHSQFVVQKYTGETMFKGISDGAFEAYYDNSKKFETTSSGVYVGGSITAATNIGNKGTNIGQQLELGDSSVTTLRFDADAWRIYAGGSGSSGEALRVTEAGNVGIGTTSPQVQLHVAKNSPFPNVNAVTSSNTGFVVSGNDGLMDLLSFDDNTTVATSLGMGRYSQTTGSIIDKWGLVTWYDTGNQGSNLSDRLAISYGTNKTPWSNSEKVSITREGNVGIGTPSPSAKLDVNGGSDNLLATFKSTDDLAYISFQDNNTTSNTSVALGANDNNLVFFTGTAFGSERMRITSGGNVGIGTTSPTEKLEVSGNILIDSIGQELQFSNHNVGAYRDGNNRLMISGYGGIRFQAENVGGMENQATRMVINPSGDVGIGTNSPSAKLEIQDGSIKLNNTSSYPSTNRILATWNGSSSPPMGGIGWEQNPGFIGSEWTHYKQTSPYTMARIRLIGDASSGGMFVNLNGSDVFTIQTSSGNVGIGTTNPQTNLHIKGSSNSAFTGTGEHLVRIESDTTNNQYTGIGFSQASGIDIAKIAMKRTSSGSNLFFGTSNNYGNGVTNAALVIDHSGNVGMGITTPSSNMSSSKVLELSSTGNAEIVLDHIDGGTASDIGLLSFERSGDHLAHIKATHDGATDSAFISFHTQATGGSFSNAASNEKMRITSAGNVGIGAASPSSKLHVKDTSLTGTLAYFEASASAQGTTNVRVDCLQYGIGIAFFRDGSLGGGACSFRNDSGTQVGSINIGTSSTFYSTSSDYRLKENLTLITDGIDRLKQLKPKRFNFIGETQTVDGFIAHEAKEVVPESVTGEKDEVLLNGDPVYQGIDQSKIVPLLTAALQEAVKKIEDLETRIQTLEKK